MPASDAPLFLATRLVLAGVLLVTQARAQPLASPNVTDADLARARQRHAMPTDAELARHAPASNPRIEALPQTLTSTPVDLEALARGFAQGAASAASGIDAGPRLLVFISFSMPEATLVRLADQAALAQATLVLRGLVNGSLRETLARVHRLIGHRRLDVQIDPLAFDRYGVQATPTFVLLRDGAAAAACREATCTNPTQHASVTGDVTTMYALRHLGNRPGFARSAAVIQARLTGRAR